MKEMHWMMMMNKTNKTKWLVVISYLSGTMKGKRPEKKRFQMNWKIPIKLRDFFEIGMKPFTYNIEKGRGCELIATNLTDE